MVRSNSSFLVGLTKVIFSPTDNMSLDDGSVGEVSIQVDLFTHPGTGEHKVTVKGMSNSIFYYLGECMFLQFDVFVKGLHFPSTHIATRN